MEKIIFIMTVCISSLLSQCAAQPEFRILKTFHIQSPGGWDYLRVGPGTDHLYVSHGTQVNILNKTTGDSLGVIENTTGVHGIAFDQTINRGFTSNGRLNNVTVFDLKNNAIISQIPVGENPDAILYEPYTKKIITCNGRSKDLSIIDPVNQKLDATIPVEGKPETAVSGEDGKLYVNLEDKSEIAVVDLKSQKKEASWSILPAEEPTGLAIDRKTKRLFAGCGNKLIAVMNLENGKLIKTLPIGAGCDGIAFDPLTQYIYASNGEGTLSIYHEKTPDDYELVTTVQTKRGARTITLDPETHLIYLPTAEFEPQDANNQGGRPKMIPGTFQVMVIGH